MKTTEAPAISDYEKVLSLCAEHTVRYSKFLTELTMLIAGRGVTTETVEELLECLGGSKQIIDTELVPDWIRTKEEANRKKMLHIIALALNQGQV